jgi:predicted oxidoreductase
MVDTAVPKTTVTGVIAQNTEGQYIKFMAKKAVVLSGGDYGGNPEMYRALQDEQRWLYESHGLDTGELCCSGFGRNGSVIKMGLWAGGSMDPCPRALVSPQVMFKSDDYATNVLRWGAGFAEGQNPWGNPFVWLDSKGKRFTDETFMGVYGQLQRAERMKPGRYYAFFDKKWADLMSRSAPEHFSQPMGTSDTLDYEALFASWVERGAKGAETTKGGTVCAWGANTLEELLDYMGFNEEMKVSVKAEIETYNTYCENGEDEDFGRDPKMLLPINEGPFFGMYSVAENPMTGTVTLNGLVIDENQRVLDYNYNPIVNLYACGNNSGGRFALEYSTPIAGLTLGMAMTLGRVLGKELTA